MVRWCRYLFCFARFLQQNRLSSLRFRPCNQKKRGKRDLAQSPMIFLPTSEPESLLEAIKSAIDAHRIRTWSYDDDGDFTHTAEQWKQSAWLSPKLSNDGLRFYILPPADAQISRQIYAIYHGRFIEMALRHFDSHLSGYASASPFPEGEDQIE